MGTIEIVAAFVAFWAMVIAWLILPSQPHVEPALVESLPTAA